MLKRTYGVATSNLFGVEQTHRKRMGHPRLLPERDIGEVYCQVESGVYACPVR
ncbi:hypothetical protein ACFLQG_00470 [Candidatus Zixiibacteriota bacterium]